jgi:DNA mismatch endonuclease Vsr
MDKITPEARSRNMSLIRSKNTKPEIFIRRILFRQGLRYRIHTSLPGRPDIVFPSKRIAVFVHGCYWHGHGCEVDHISKSNTEFWQNKIKNNKERDKRSANLLKELRWQVFTIWECDVRKNNLEVLSRIIQLVVN